MCVGERPDVEKRTHLARVSSPSLDEDGMLLDVVVGQVLEEVGEGVSAEVRVLQGLREL